LSKAEAPILGVGAVVFHNNAVLLVKRKNPPNAGQWAVPGGKVKFGETLQAAAERELFEETGVSIRAGEVIYQFEVIEHDAAGNVQLHFVVVDLHADYLSGEPQAADDVSKAQWIERGECARLEINEITRTLLKEKYHFP
jgi:8-oxo-dGTP diphosphatase